MKITFNGAAQSVTGSKHLVSAGGQNILLDCGLYQGRRLEAYELNKQLPFKAEEIDAVILSHAHTDHCGALPLLVKNGFRGEILATPTTVAIARLIMLDAAKVQLQDYQHFLKHSEGNRQPLPPLYSAAEVETACEYFSSVNYARRGPEWHQLNENCRFKFYDAGHILGSAVTVLETKEKYYTNRLAFTGDLGNTNVPILNEAERIQEPVETLITECTYGDRNHRKVDEVNTILSEIIKDAVAQKRRVIIPAFALGRTQELIYILHKLYDANRIPQIPIYVDSPLANNITSVFSEHYEDFDENSWKDFFSKHESPFAFGNLKTIVSVEDSKKLNSLPGPCLIIASSGMCEGGRIIYHLQHAVADPKAVILITGFQAEHTLGRKLVEGVSPLKIYDKMYEVKAKIMTLNELSAHADQTSLFNYLKNITGLKNVFLVHGETTQAAVFKKFLNNKLPKLKVIIPKPGEQFEV